MVSYSGNFFENDIRSVVILIFVINMLPNILNTYIGPQFLRAAKDNDIVRNICVFLGIFLLVELSGSKTDKLEKTVGIFVFLFTTFSKSNS